MPRSVGRELLLFLYHISPVLDSGQDGRIRRGAANALLFQRLDQRGLGIARRGLGEVLLGPQLQQVEQLAFIERWKGALVEVIVFVANIVSFAINADEPSKLYDRARCAEGVGPGRGVRRLCPRPRLP